MSRLTPGRSARKAPCRSRVLRTHLANRGQPAIRARRRSANTLAFVSQSGARVSVNPLVFELDEIRGIDLSQIVQISRMTFRVRLRVSRRAVVDGVWHEVDASVRRILDAHGLANVSVERGEEEPEQTSGGKYRTVVPLSESRT